MIIMGAGGVLVAALVVWALTRSVDPVTQPAQIPAPVPAAATEPGSTQAFDTSGRNTPNAASASLQDPQMAAVGRISAEDLKAKFDRGEVTVIDVRGADQYAGSHIPGSINIPMTAVEANIDSLPKGKAIVTYCT